MVFRLQDKDAYLPKNGTTYFTVTISRNNGIFQVKVESDTNEVITASLTVGIDEVGPLYICNYGDNTPQKKGSGYTYPYLPSSEEHPFNTYIQNFYTMKARGTISYKSESKKQSQSFTLNNNGTITMTFNKYL